MTTEVGTTYVVRCSQCGHRESYSDYQSATEDAKAHDARHRDMAAIGRTLKGRVFDTNAPGVPWFGFIDAAVEHARTEGWAFLAWNGRVFPTIDPNLHNPLCMANDVEGLTS